MSMSCAGMNVKCVRNYQGMITEMEGKEYSIQINGWNFTKSKILNNTSFLISQNLISDYF